MSGISSMRLQTRLWLAFAIVAALPLFVVPVIIRSVTASFDLTFAQALDDAAVVVGNEFGRTGEEVARTTTTLAPGLIDEVVRLAENDPAALVDLGPTLLERTGLDILTVLDRDGRVLVSAHLPARTGDIDPGAVELASHDAPSLAPIEVRSGAEIVRIDAIVAAVRFASGPVAAIIGGRRFAEPQLERLGALVRGRVNVVAKGAPDRRTPRHLLGRLFGLEDPMREIPMGRGDRVLRLRLPDEALIATKARIAIGALGTFVLALVLGLLLARIVARRLVEPVEALVAGTRRVARGELGTTVEVRATGELAQLVTAFNGMSQDLVRSREKLAHAERVAAWEQIARALAHEIKNPLTPIAMAIETLQRTHARQHPDFERFFREGTATVLEEVGRLKRLASEFGEFARWPKPVVSPATPAEIVHAAAALYSSLPDGISLREEVEPDLPTIAVDRDQMQRALVNLVKNAIEAMPRGGSVTLRARRSGAGIAIEVADSGAGIPADTRARLFQPYFTTKAEGTGLGLAIVQRIVEEHGGRIEADETPGGGATFRIRLPTGTVPARASRDDAA